MSLLQMTVSKMHNDVLLFAQVCFGNGEYHRAMDVMRKYQLVGEERVSCDRGREEIRIPSALLYGQCMVSEMWLSEVQRLMRLPADQRETV